MTSPPDTKAQGEQKLWYASEIFRRDWSIEAGFAKGEIVEWKCGNPFSSNHSEAFIDVVLASDYSALVAENERLCELLKHFTVRPSFHHDCDDYSRGYGDALAVVATQATNALSTKAIT